ncbi:MAG: chemotaxis protein CheW [bacterium]
MQVLSLTAQGLKILLPVNMVAQIIGRAKLVQDPAQRFKSNAGDFRWREYSVPLLRTSELVGASESADDEYERIVVLWPMKSASSRSFIGLTSLAPPRVIEISGQPSAERPADTQYILDCVQLDGDLGLIPDIDQVSRDLFEDSGQNS